MSSRNRAHRAGNKAQGQVRLAEDQAQFAFGGRAQVLAMQGVANAKFLAAELPADTKPQR